MAYENLSATERLIALAGVTRVDAHKRTTKSGKVVNVEAYTRAVTGMTNMELFTQYSDLNKGKGPEEWSGPTKAQQIRNRLQQVTNEIRERQAKGEWGHSDVGAQTRAQKRVDKSAGATLRGRKESRAQFEENQRSPKKKIERTQKYDTGEKDEKGEPVRKTVRDEEGREVETPEYKAEIERLTKTLDSIFGNKEKGIPKNVSKIKKYDTQQRHGIFEEVTDAEGNKREVFIAYTPERAEQHKKIIKDILEKHANVPTDRKAVMSGGLGGAGKGHVLEKFAGIDENEFIVIDTDEMKKEILRRGMGPDVPGLLPMEQAAFIHEESSDLANMLHEIAMREGKNIILDTTMAAKGGTEDQSSADGKIKKFEDAGYEIRGIFVDVPVEVSVASALDRHVGGVNRFNKGESEGDGDLGGRYVPPAYIEASRPGEGSPYNSKNRAVFERLRKEGRFSQSEVWDNSDRSRDPQLVDRLQPSAAKDASKTSQNAVEKLKKQQEKASEKVALSAVQRLINLTNVNS